MAELRAEVRGDIAALRADLRTEVAALHKWGAGIVAANTVAMIAALLT